MDVGDGLGRQLDLASGGNPIRFGKVIVLEPGEEGDKLLAGEGCKGSVVLEVTAHLLQRRLMVQDCVWALSGGLLVVDEAFAGLGQGKLADHKASSLAGDSDNRRF